MLHPSSFTASFDYTYQG